MIYYIILFSLFLNPLIASGQETVDIQVPLNNYKFVPNKVTIKAGDTVIWHNNDERQHVLASVPGSGSSDDLEIFAEKFHPGTVYSHTFKEPGEYPYFCFIHKQMTGVIIVQGKDK